MKKIFNLAWNDIRIEFSEKSTLVFFLVLPLIFTAILGVSMGGGETDPDADTRTAVVVIDEDATGTSELLIRNLEDSSMVRPVVLEDPDLEELFSEYNQSASLTIPSGFEDALSAGESSKLELSLNPNASDVLAIEQAVSTAASKTNAIYAAASNAVEQREKLEPFATWEERETYYYDSLLLAEEILAEPVGEVLVTSSVEDDESSQIATGFELASPGQLVSWVLITLLGASIVFVYERTGGTLQRLMVTPTSKATIVLGKILGRYGMGILQMAILIIFGALLFGVNWGDDPLAIALVVLSFGLAAVALGVLMGTFVKTYSQANGITIMASMLFSALGGAWWPLEITPTAYQTVVKVLPTTWAMTAFTDIITRGQGLGAVLPEIGILLGFAAVFFTVGIWRLRFE